MTELSLGLDVGTTSIGWALIESDSSTLSGRVLACGVRIFPEGVDRDQRGGEKSKSQDRRTARGMRRQIARRRSRRMKLRARLAAAGLLPADPAALAAILDANPYPLRADALQRPLTPYEIGRVFLHLAQRRGFLSNRKSDRPDQNKGLHAEISTLARHIQDAQCLTLGQFLARRSAEFRHASPPPLPSEKDHKAGAIVHTIRGLHTRRDMYINEFERIWTAQRPHHPTLLTDQLKTDLYQPDLTPAEKENWVCRGLIFGQRRMYWPKAVIGRCDLERRQRRCPLAHRAAQQFRILQEVNNLRLIDTATGEERRLSPEERSTLTVYLNDSEKRSFDDIRKKLRLTSSTRFNLEGPDRDKLKGNSTDALLASRKAIGQRYKSLSDAAKDAIVHILIHEEREDEALAALTRDPCNLTDEEAQKSLAVHLPDKYASFSLEAIRKLLPHLQRGLPLMGNDPSDSALHAAGYLRPDQREIKTAHFLPPSPDLPNPIVRAALVEVRRVVNAILRELCDPPADKGGLTGGRRPDIIRIELAREAKKSIEQRTQMRFDNKKRQDDRDLARSEVEAAGIQPTPGAIRKYLLWKEQGETCAYSYPVRKISLTQLLSDAVDVDHILPRWQSLDDSMMNKVLAFREENHEKGQRTPREWLEHAHSDKWESVLQRAGNLPYPKFRRFLQSTAVLDDFVNRQFTDTAYITTATVQYLKCLGIAVATPRGGMTAELRRLWGLNGILGDTGEKNRADHRHHAIDAVVIALVTPRRLHALANARGRDVPPPWSSLRADLEPLIARMNVSHRALRRIRGALHEETIYGPTQKRADAAMTPGSPDRPWAIGWIEDDKTVVRRKPVESITDAGQLEKVRDPAIRRILESHVRALSGGELPSKLPKKCFEGINTPRMPSGVPIRRVRMVETGEMFRAVSQRRFFQFVKPGSNHHVSYFEDSTPKGPSCIAKVTSMWDAATLARRGNAIVNRADASGRRFLLSVSIGESFYLKEMDGSLALCVVHKITNAAVGVRLFYKHHTDARPNDKRKELMLSPKQVLARVVSKVVIDPIGRPRRTRD